MPKKVAVTVKSQEKKAAKKKASKKKSVKKVQKAGDIITNKAQKNIVDSYQDERGVELSEGDLKTKKDNVRKLIVRGVTSVSLIAKTVGVSWVTSKKWYEEIHTEFGEFTNSIQLKNEFGKTINQIDKVISEIWTEIITSNMTGEDKIKGMTALINPIMKRAELMGFLKDDTHLKSPQKEVSVHQESNVNIYNYFAAMIGGKPEDIERLKSMGVAVDMTKVGKINIDDVVGVKRI